MAKPKSAVEAHVQARIRQFSAVNTAAKAPAAQATDWSLEIAKIESVYINKPAGGTPQTKTASEKAAIKPKPATKPTTTAAPQTALRLQKQAEEKRVAERKAAAAKQAAEKQAAEKKAKEEAFAKKFQALLALEPILNSLAVQGDGNINTDAHKYTRSIINPHLPIVLQIDAQYIKADGTLTPATVLQEALQCANPEWVANIQNTFSYIPANKNAIEAETGATIHEFLSKTWVLAKKLGQQKQIAETLHLNIADAGKCMAGLMARLYSPYVKIIHHLLKKSIEQEAALVPSHTQNRTMAF